MNWNIRLRVSINHDMSNVLRASVDASMGET